MSFSKKHFFNLNSAFKAQSCGQINSLMAENGMNVCWGGCSSGSGAGHLLKRKFEPWLLRLACQTILGKDTEHVAL